MRLKKNQSLPNSMKQPILILLFCLGLIPTLNAQYLEGTVSIGHTFGDRAAITGGVARIYPGTVYGLSANYFLDDYFSFEMMYQFQELRGTANSSFWQIDIDQQIRLNYVLVGGNRYLDLSDKAFLYSGLKFGVLNVSSASNNFRSITRFAVAVNGGFRYSITEKLALKTQLNLLLPIMDVGASIWWSPGEGTSVGVVSSTPFAQFGGSFGLIYRIFSN